MRAVSRSNRHQPQLARESDEIHLLPWTCAVSALSFIRSFYIAVVRDKKHQTGGAGTVACAADWYARLRQIDRDTERFRDPILQVRSRAGKRKRVGLRPFSVGFLDDQFCSSAAGRIGAEPRRPAGYGPTWRDCLVNQVRFECILRAQFIRFRQARCDMKKSLTSQWYVTKLVPLYFDIVYCPRWTHCFRPKANDCCRGASIIRQSYMHQPVYWMQRKTASKGADSDKIAQACPVGAYAPHPGVTTNGFLGGGTGGGEVLGSKKM